MSREPRPDARREMATAVALVIALCATPSRAQPDLSTPREEFLAVCNELRASSEGYFGEAPAAEHARRLTEPFTAPDEEARTRLEYGRELLELGRPLEAIAQFEQALGQAAALEPSDAAWLVKNLALAHLRASEDLNCLQHHNAASCILPIRDEGVHERPEHAQIAVRALLQLLKGDPGDAENAWLLNVAAMVGGVYPEAVPPGLRAPSERLGSVVGENEWRDRAHELGVAAVDLAGGAVMDDFDGDSRLDLISTSSHPCGPIQAFRNDGKGGFEDVAEAWGLAEQLGGLNLVHADYDNDGRLDLLILRGAWLGANGKIRNSLLRNEASPGGLRFVDTTRAAGVAEPAAPTQTAAWADFDGDGDLDLYLGNETEPAVPIPSQLFANDGDGTFTEVTERAGVGNGRFTKGVAWGDYDDDGDPDLYLSNIGANRLYRNDGDGRFSDVAEELGVTEPIGRSFASWFFDPDNDGDLDLFVADYSAEVEAVAAYYLGQDVAAGQPRLYRNDGGRFVESSRDLGLTMPALVMGANFGDLDNDGFEDLYLGTGDPEFETLFPNLVLRNEAGARFVERTDAFRLGHLQKGHGIAFGDVDNDGDQDLFHQLGGFYPGDSYANALFENPGGSQRWITLKLEGRRANRFAIGARIDLRVRSGETVRRIARVVGSGSSFGGSSLQAEIGLGDADAIEELRIQWPGSGTDQRWTELELNTVYRVVEGEDRLEPLTLEPVSLAPNRP